MKNEAASNPPETKPETGPRLASTPGSPSPEPAVVSRTLDMVALRAAIYHVCAAIDSATGMNMPAGREMTAEERAEVQGKLRDIIDFARANVIPLGLKIHELFAFCGLEQPTQQAVPTPPASVTTSPIVIAQKVPPSTRQERRRKSR